MINHRVEITDTFQGDTLMDFFTLRGINGGPALIPQQSWQREEQSDNLQ